MQDFYQIFVAPGVEHYGIGSGAQPPKNLPEALLDWVEKGITPDTLPASTTNVITGANMTRNLRPYPLVETYNGTGDPNSASSFTCEALELPYLEDWHAK